MKKYFKCDTCGKDHLTIGTIEITELPALQFMTSLERSKRVFEKEHFYLLDNQVWITKANLFIRLEPSDDYFHFEIWVKFPNERMRSILNSKGQSTYEIPAQIACSLPFYRHVENMDIGITFFTNNLNELPEVTSISNDSELALDYKLGLSKRKYESWMMNYYHSDQTNNRVLDN